MWTYRNEASSISSEHNPHISSYSKRNGGNTVTTKSQDSVPPKGTARHFMHRTVHAKNHFSFFSFGALLYLMGILLGSLWHPGTDTWLYGYAQNYMNSQILRVLERQIGLIFCAQFLALIMQLLFAALAGFCAFGVIILPVLVLVKGIGSGFFVSFLYLEYGIVKGICMELSFFLFPQLLGLLLLLSQGTAAWKLSLDLLAVCTHHGGMRSTTESKRVLNRFLICSAASFIPCTLACASSALFARLFLS